MTMQPRKCGARTALYPPALPRTLLPGYSSTQPPLDGMHFSTVKGCNAFQPALPFLHKQTQHSQLCKELNWKSNKQIIFFPRLILTQSFVQGTHHTHVCASTQSQCRDRVCLFTLSAVKQRQGYRTATHVTNLCAHMHKLSRWQWTYPPKKQGKTVKLKAIINTAVRVLQLP